MPYGYRRARSPYRRVGGYKRRAPSTNRYASATKIQRVFRRKAARKVFTRRVNSIVSRKMETKIRTIQLMNQQDIWGAGLSTVGTITQNGHLIPNLFDSLVLNQGLTDQNRIGNETQTRSLRLRGFVKSKPYNNSTNTSFFPLELHMIIFKKKASADGNPDNLKSLANTTTGPIDGSAQNTLLPWNKDLYTIYTHKVWKLRSIPAIVSQTVGATNDAVIPNPGYGASTNPSFVRFSVKVPCPKKLKFNDGLNKPTNSYLSVGFYYIDGSGDALGALQKRAAVSMDMVYSYADA